MRKRRNIKTSKLSTVRGLATKALVLAMSAACIFGTASTVIVWQGHNNKPPAMQVVGISFSYKQKTSSDTINAGSPTA